MARYLSRKGKGSYGKINHLQLGKAQVASRFVAAKLETNVDNVGIRSDHLHVITRWMILTILIDYSHKYWMIHVVGPGISNIEDKISRCLARSE